MRPTKYQASLLKIIAPFAVISTMDIHRALTKTGVRIRPQNTRFQLEALEARGLVVCNRSRSRGGFLYHLTPAGHTALQP